jgi:carboxymethylenebutenolidase
MGETIRLTSGADGFAFSAYHEQPFTPRKGGVVVLQEIFGIDRYIREDVERWAKAGYEVVAPSLFDRRQAGFTAGHDAEGMAAGVAHARETPRQQALADIAACRDFLSPRGKVYAVGYCYGGSLAWIAAAELNGLAAASSYYGSLVKASAHLRPRCPTIVHLGREDKGIPADETAEAVRAANPDVAVYIYEGAGHGFNNSSPDRYAAEAADLARHHTRELFAHA